MPFFTNSKPASSSSDTEFLEIQKAVADAISKSREEEARILEALGQEKFTDRDRAMRYFVIHFSIKLVNLYIFYQKFKQDDTFFNKCINYLKSNAAEAIAKDATKEAVGAVVQVAGGSAQDQKMAEGIASTVIKVMFFFYHQYKNEIKAVKLDKARKLALYADTPEKMTLLAKQLALHLFYRLEFFIMDLSRPTGVDELIDFMMESILSGIKDNEPTKNNEDKIFELKRYAIPKPNLLPSLYKTLPIFSSPNKTIKNNNTNAKWYIEGGLCGAPVFVKASNRIFGYNSTLRFDGKYPPHFLETEQEAAVLGLTCIDEFYWGSFETKSLDKQLKILENYTATLIFLLPYISRNTDINTNWIQNQFSHISNLYLKIYDKISNRDQHKKIFEHLLQLCKSVNEVENDHPWVKVFYSHLSEIFKKHYDNSQERDHIKWKHYADRLLVLGVNINEHLPEQLHSGSSALVTTDSRKKAPTPKNVLNNPILNASPKVAPKPFFEETPPQLLPKIDEDNNITISVIVWETNLKCTNIAISIGADTPFRICFSVANPNNTRSNNNPQSLLDKLKIRRIELPNYYINNTPPAQIYKLTKLDANKILMTFNKLYSDDPQIQQELSALYSIYTQMPFYNKDTSNHLHMAIFLLIQGGFNQLCDMIDDTSISKRMLHYGAVIGFGAAVGAVATTAVPVAVTSAIAASTGSIAVGTVHFHAAVGLAALFGPVGLGVAIGTTIIAGAGFGALAIYRSVSNRPNSPNVTLANIYPNHLMSLAFEAHQSENVLKKLPPPPSTSASAPSPV